eukprot:352764-Chlamydomonas_euryale.AAC.2
MTRHSSRLAPGPGRRPHGWVARTRPYPVPRPRFPRCREGACNPPDGMWVVIGLGFSWVSVRS